MAVGGIVMGLSVPGCLQKNGIVCDYEDGFSCQGTLQVGDFEVTL